MTIKRIALILLALIASACSTITPSPIAATAPPTATATIAPPTKVPATIIPPTATIAPVVYTPPDCQGKPIATIPPATTIAKPTSSLTTNPSIVTAEQLKVFDATVNKINAIYLYPDFNGIDWPGIVASYRITVESGLDTDKFYADMENLITELGDEHSSFESPADFAAAKAELAGTNNYVGIGVLIKPLPAKNRDTVLALFPDSSAAHDGRLHPHDDILAVDGQPVVENGESYPQRIRGPECSAVVLTVQSPGQSPRDITLIRYRINAPLPVDTRLVSTTDGSRIGYIFLPTFYDETIPAQVKKALEDFGPLDGLILDNRMNGGGSNDVLVPVLRYFTAGTLGHFVSRTATRTLSLKADPINNSQTVPLIVLVGEDTVSAGEIFPGILQDMGRAKVVGQTTLGNVEAVHGYYFQDGSRLWIAQERFDPEHSHANWEQTGIIPDVQAFADWDTFTFDTDPSIAAAVKLLGHK